MSWLIFAFSGSVLWAISTHLDKYLVERFFKNSDVAVLLVFTALVGIVTLPFIWLFVPAVLFVRAADMGLMTLSGVGGTSLVSIRFGKHAARFKARIAGLMLTCAMFVALSSLLFKIFAVRDEFWTTTFWMFVGEGIFGAVLLAYAPYRRQFMALLRQNTGAVLAINAANELINLGGGLGNRYALMLAPLSLVQAIGSTTSLFVFAFGVVLSLCLPALGRESISASELTQKGGAALLVAVGVILVSG